MLTPVGPFLIGLLVTLGAGWLLIPILQKLKAKQVISGDAPKRHQAKAGTPTMGGLIILAGVGVAALPYLPSADGHLLLAVLSSTLCFGVIGFLDDLLIVLRGRNLGLRAREKLAGQFVVALAFAGWYYVSNQPSFVSGGPLGSWGRLLLAAYHVLLLVGMSNAVNLTDGLDGLAAGVSLPAWLILTLLGVLALGPAALVKNSLAAAAGSYGVVCFAAAFAGATLGYLWYNAHPAQVFMGDTGSLAIGGGMAATAIALRLEWALLLIGLVHIAEAASVTVQVIVFQYRKRRYGLEYAKEHRVFRRTPLHHHFEELGVPETRIVARFSLVSALCGILALVLAFWG
jgi:phospho-N-acetylmuramoyl-pentapeptide-transferase